MLKHEVAAMHTNEKSESLALGFLAGVAGFGPTNARVKVWCLTAWLYPNIFSIPWYYITFYFQCQGLILLFLKKFCNKAKSLLTIREKHDKIGNGSEPKSTTEGYRSGHNEAVLKTSFVCLCKLSKTLDLLDFFGGSIASCEKCFSQFSRKFPT